jgi:hypothetical protein
VLEEDENKLGPKRPRIDRMEEFARAAGCDGDDDDDDDEPAPVAYCPVAGAVRASRWR